MNKDTKSVDVVLMGVNEGLQFSIGLTGISDVHGLVQEGDINYAKITIYNALRFVCKLQDHQREAYINQGFEDAPSDNFEGLLKYSQQMGIPLALTMMVIQLLPFFRFLLHIAFVYLHLLLNNRI